MKIGGFTKQSFIDWEGKTTAVIFTKGCNFRCGYCHNPSLVVPELMNNEPDLAINGIMEHLKNRTNWLDGVVVTGGEPTIHNDLPEFIHEIKSMGYPVKLDTNGTNTQMLQMLIDEKRINFVAMDIKTIPEPGTYQKIIDVPDEIVVKNIRTSLDILHKSGIEYQLRTTCINSHHTQTVTERLKKLFKNENYILQEFREGDIVGNYF